MGPGADLRGADGLSPRVRGNLIQIKAKFLAPGSIPACAGEPRPEAGIPVSQQVYPRVCGGTVSDDQPWMMWPGLSPRVRGNPRRYPRPDLLTRVYPRVCGGTCLSKAKPKSGGGLSPRVRGNLGSVHSCNPLSRSIPACAGEPMKFPKVATFSKVYPRVCGGTITARRRNEGRYGLSPRVRGNRANVRL